MDVTLQNFNTTPSKKAFIAAVADAMNVSASAIVITGFRTRPSTIFGPKLEIFYRVNVLTYRSADNVRYSLEYAVHNDQFSLSLQTFASQFGAKGLGNATSTEIDGAKTSLLSLHSKFISFRLQ